MGWRWAVGVNVGDAVAGPAVVARLGCLIESREDALAKSESARLGITKLCTA